MSNLVLTDAKVLVGPYDLSGYANQVELSFSAEMLDATTWSGTKTRKNVAGLLNASLSVSGFNDYDRTNPDSSGIDDLLHGRIGAVAVPATVSPSGLAEGDRAFSFKHVNGSYTPVAGAVGELATFQLDGQSVGSRLVRGTIVGMGAKVATGNGSPHQLGAVAVGQKIYACLHCVAASGGTPTLTVEIESDDAVGFTDPTTRLSFTQLTGVGSQWLELAGAITDTYWRAKWTVGGSTPSFTIWVIIGIH